MPRVDFPKFDGTNPRDWMLKCNNYFKIIPNIPYSKRVTLASMQFEGKAAQWYQNIAQKNLEFTWDQFLQLISAQFDELKENTIIPEFNKLR